MKAAHDALKRTGVLAGIEGRTGEEKRCGTVRGTVKHVMSQKKIILIAFLFFLVLFFYFLPLMYM